MTDSRKSYRRPSISPTTFIWRLPRNTGGRFATFDIGINAQLVFGGQAVLHVILTS